MRRFGGWVGFLLEVTVPIALLVLWGAWSAFDPFYARTAPNLTVATYFASKELISSKPELVDRFKTAMEKSLQYAQENPDAVREVLPEYTQIPKEAAEKINLPSWEADLHDDTIQKLSELEDKDVLKRRIEEATQFVDLDQLCLSPQCGFSSTVEGNKLTADQQAAKLRLIVETAEEVSG